MLNRRTVQSKSYPQTQPQQLTIIHSLMSTSSQIKFIQRDCPPITGQTVATTETDQPNHVTSHSPDVTISPTSLTATRTAPPPRSTEIRLVVNNNNDRLRRTTSAQPSSALDVMEMATTPVTALRPNQHRRSQRNDKDSSVLPQTAT